MSLLYRPVYFCQAVANSFLGITKNLWPPNVNNPGPRRPPGYLLKGCLSNWKLRQLEAKDCVALANVLAKRCLSFIIVQQRIAGSGDRIGCAVSLRTERACPLDAWFDLKQ